MQQVARLTMIALAMLGTVAHAKPGDTPAPNPCVNRGVQDGARRTLHDATATASAVAFCTGEDCWSLDLASSTFTSIPTIKAATPVRRGGQGPGHGSGQGPGQGPGKSADGRATATATEASFCPTPTSCKKFTYKFEFEPGNGVYPMINAQGTLGAVIYAGIGEDHEPSYVLTYDLAAGKLIKQVKQTTSFAEVFGSSFLINGAFYSAKLKKLAKQAISTPDLVRLTGTDLVAMTDPDRGDLIIQDAATGKAHPRIKLGGWVDQKLSSPDGSRLFAIVYGPHEGEVFVIDVAKNKVASHLVPPKCADGTARAR